MKELSIEEKAKLYDEAIIRAKSLIGDTIIEESGQHIAEVIFPELKESEDERIRKYLIDVVNDYCKGSEHDGCIAWLEKQGEQKLVDKVEPKFKVGDWIVYHRNDSSTEIMNVYDIRDNRYYFNDNIHFSWSVKECDEKCHIWTIQDAKDGDVLSWDGSKCIAIFKNIYDEDSFNSYGFVGHCTGTFESRQSYHDIEGAHPAPKEQRDLLFQKMKEKGYEWDVEKKELKKIL